MTATYPDDATINPEIFPVLSSVTYTDTGSETVFNLNSSASHTGTVLAYADGVEQSTDSYTLSNNGITVTYATAPASSNLTMKVIDVSTRFSTIRNFPSLLAENYSNGTVTIVNSNSYVVDGVRTAWALPAGSNVQSKTDILLSVSGIAQLDSSYTWPSSSLGNQGIDISPALPDYDTVIVRTLDSSYQTQDRFSSMADRKPDRGNQESLRFDSTVMVSQAGYEKRRLQSRRGKRRFSLKYTNVTGVEEQAIRNFYNERSGIYEAFIFDLTHINKTGTINARFDSELKTAHIQSKGTALADNIYTVEFDLLEVYD